MGDSDLDEYDTYDYVDDTKLQNDDCGDYELDIIHTPD